MADANNGEVAFMSDLTTAQVMQSLGAFAIAHGLNMQLRWRRDSGVCPGYVRLVAPHGLASLVVDLSCGGCELQVAGDAGEGSAVSMLEQLQEDANALVPLMPELNRRFAMEVPF